MYLQLAKYLFIIVPIVILLVIINNWRLDSVKLVEVQNSLTECIKTKNTTKETNDALQKDRDAIAVKLANAKRLRPNSCLPIADKTNVNNAGGEYARQNGVNTDTLRDYAASCETYRSERIRLEQIWDK